MEDRDVVDPLADSLAPVVYFIGAWDVGRVKIGLTTAGRLADRAWEIMQSSPVELKVLGFQPGDFKLERELHERFAHANVGGEWFEMTDDVMSHIDENAIKSWGCRRPMMGWLARRPFAKQRRRVNAEMKRPVVPPRAMDEPEYVEAVNRDPESDQYRVEIRLTPEQADVLKHEYARLKGDNNASLEEVVGWMMSKRVSKAMRVLSSAQ